MKWNYVGINSTANQATSNHAKHQIEDFLVFLVDSSNRSKARKQNQARYIHTTITPNYQRMGKNRKRSKTSTPSVHQDKQSKNSSSNNQNLQKIVEKEESRVTCQNPASDSSDSESESEDDELVLEGVLQKVQHDEDDDEEFSSEEEEDTLPPPKKSKQTSKPNQTKPKSKKPKQKTNPNNDSDDEDVPANLNVEFLFCDMHDKYFHGMKTLLLSNVITAPHSSALSDLMIQNVSVGTVISTESENDNDANVFGFASVLNLTTHKEEACIQSLKRICTQHCPKERASEMEVLFGGKTARPAGIYLHNRMINLPLEITKVLHDQLTLDMDWAVDHAEGGIDERKSLDFGAFVVLAPCTEGSGGGSNSVVYKHFDDEIFANNAEFVYTFEVQRSASASESSIKDEKQFCSVVVLTKTGHRESLRQLADMLSV
mmetsp:Transcript_36110/g.52939  ORF Transcript_36110/g.52939 Transcript_36110/m.52939 type:complete len:430 (-) Transcript_36110:49-1338(-)|eukprot:CAMPEP_0195510350 /NCGR_PEP_ID=MMETSP0794_2-20130614/3021_1 /TAXON_ID=515487 /ORGANISM="Stephanopyxis turris, Strain CCMP 815" /LENGTH=429 /DNA_ID=CAMNT_0040637757 /DNA_START=11 /DNA_END=1300 /DNA_ORIENTATION=-